MVPSIALAEIWYLHGRGRLPTSPDDVRALLESLPNSLIYPLDELVLDLLPVGLEMHDGVIAATALLLSGASDPVVIVTNDRQIRSSGLVAVAW